jgi:hypothetical protein
MAAERYKEIVRQHRPAGYQLTERSMNANYGLTTFSRSISCEPIVDSASLFIFLHECGHVHLKHLTRKVKLPTWREEYEADQYAIHAMKALGIPLPRVRLREAKEVLRDDILKGQHKHEEIDEEVLKYAHGKSWRHHR